MSQEAISIIIVLITFAIYIGIAIWSRVKETSGFYVAGRSIPPFFNGMAVGADWMSAASFIGMAGSIMAFGYDGLAFVMGWTGGYVLLAVFLAPQLRKFGQYTVPDFVGDRYESNIARTVAIICAIVVSFTYVVAQMNGAGIVLSRLFAIDYRIGIILAIIIISIYAVLGGMKGITWTQVAQYIILITAYLVPIILMGSFLFRHGIMSTSVPWLGYGEVLQSITDIQKNIGITNLTVRPFTDMSKLNFILLTFMLMVGTAGLPHVIVRFYTVPSLKAARWSAAWALLFICLLYLSAPAYAAFTQHALLTQVAGQPIDQLPMWVQKWGQVGLFSFNDANADGILQWAEMTIHKDIVVLAAPEIAGLSKVVVGLVAAGGMAAALSTAGGLLLVISSSVAHDLWYRILRPDATEAQRVTAGRIAIVCATVISGLVAINPPGIIVQVVAWAFSLAGASFFPILVLGVWWKRASTKGAIYGMITGLALTVIYLFLAKGFGITIFGIGDMASGIFGFIANFVITILVSLSSKPVSQEMQDTVEMLKYPEYAVQESK